MLGKQQIVQKQASLTANKYLAIAKAICYLNWAFVTLEEIGLSNRSLVGCWCWAFGAGRDSNSRGSCDTKTIGGFLFDSSCGTDDGGAATIEGSGSTTIKNGPTVDGCSMRMPPSSTRGMFTIPLEQKVSTLGIKPTACKCPRVLLGGYLPYL